MRLRESFFSQKNIDYLQKRIKTLVYERTQTHIAPQDSNTLYIVMNSLYDEQRFFLTNLGQLNQKVLEDIVPNLVSKIRMRETYMRDRFEPRQILDPPMVVSKKGEDTLEHGAFF